MSFLVIVFNRTVRFSGKYSNGLISCLLSSNANRLFDRTDEYLPVANLPCLGGAHDRLDGRIHMLVGQDNFNFDFGKEIYGVLAAAVDLSMAFLPTKSFHFRNGHSLNAN